MDIETSSPYSGIPEFQQQDTFIDDYETLGRLGIYVEDHDRLPLGFVKLWPQDFLVEEIARDGEIQSSYFEAPFTMESCPETSSIVSATLVKCGLSTMEAIEELTKILQCGYNQIQYAGFKDDDAITAQLISLQNIPPKILKKILISNKFSNFFSEKCQKL